MLTSAQNNKETNQQFIVRVFGGGSDRPPRFLGTGFLVSPTQILTCRHVVVENYEEKNWSKHLIREQLWIITDTVAIAAKQQQVSPHSELHVILHPDLDLALVELSSDTATILPTFLRDISFCLDTQVISHKFFVQGYIGQDNAKELKTYSIKGLMPQFTGRQVDYLEELQLGGGPVEGCSGGAVFADKKFSICVGAIYSGGRHASSSRVVTSWSILKFLKKHGITAVPTCAASIVFSTFRKKHFFILGLLSILAALLGGGAFYGRWTKQPPQVQQSMAVVSIPPAVRLPYEPASKPVPLTVASVDNCQTENLFSKDINLKILVLSFSSIGSNEKLKTASQEYAYWLKSSLEKYLEDEKKTTLWQTANLPGEIEVVRRNCPVEDHKAARELGKMKGAHVVIWGHAILGTKPVSRTTHYDSLFVPSISIIELNSLRADARKGIGLADLIELPEMDFPRLTAGKPWSLMRFILGLYTHRLGGIDLAFHYLNRTAADFLKVENSSEAAHLLSQVGMIFVENNHFAEGIELLNQAIKKCLSKDYSCEALHTYHLAIAYERQSGKKSVSLTSKALELAERSDDPHIQIIILASAALNGILPVTEKSLERLTKGSEDAVKRGDSKGAATALRAIGNHYENLSRIDEALVYYKKSLAQIGRYDYRGRNIMMYNIGQALTVDHPGESLSYFNDGLRAARESGDHYAEALYLDARGQAYAHLSKWDLALDDYRVALEYWRSNHNPTHEVQTRLTIFAAQEFLGQHQFSKAQVMAILPLLDKVDDENTKIGLYASVAKAFELLNNYQQATMIYSRAIDSYEHLANIEPPLDIYMGHANNATKIGRFSDAIHSYLRAAQIHAIASKKSEAKECLEIAAKLALTNKVHPQTLGILAEAQKLGIEDLNLNMPN